MEVHYKIDFLSVPFQSFAGMIRMMTYEVYIYIYIYIHTYIHIYVYVPIAKYLAIFEEIIN